MPIGPRVSPVGDPKRQWVDLLHDVTVADLELALRENFTAVEHVKRYTTVGMAADQGKTSAPVDSRSDRTTARSRRRDLGPHDAATSGRTRSPWAPSPAGGSASGLRRIGNCRCTTGMWRYGALMQEFGEWRRPVAYLKAGETREQAVTARSEARCVPRRDSLMAHRSGKIEIHGPGCIGVPRSLLHQ